MIPILDVTSHCNSNTLSCKQVIRTDKLIIGCYLDKTSNSPVLFTRECKAASQENY